MNLGFFEFFWGCFWDVFELEGSRMTVVSAGVLIAKVRGGYIGRGDGQATMGLRETMKKGDRLWFFEEGQRLVWGGHKGAAEGRGRCSGPLLCCSRTIEANEKEEVLL